MLTDHIEKYIRAHGFKGYTEIRAQCNSSKRFGLLKGTMVSNSAATSRGISARVVKNGAYGFASGNDFSEDGVSAIVRAAGENAAFLEAREKPGKPDFAPVEAVKRRDGFEAEDDVPRRHYADFAGELDAYIAKKYPGLSSRYVGVSSLNMEKLLYTSDGTAAHSYTPRSSLYIGMTAEDPDGQPVDLFESMGDWGKFTDVFDSPAEVFAKADELFEKLMKKREGVYAAPGLKQVILHPDLAGMLAHEAVGHTVEADFVLSGSVGGPCLGKQVASGIVTMTDFANTAFGKRCPVPVYVDDEGTPARDAVLIRDGILVGYMHNKESAAHFGVRPTGNARAYSFSDEPLIRMRNTCILPGHDKLSDMIASVDDGYYLVSTGNGQADATGEFMFGIEFGYEIKKGKLGRAIKNTTISGVAFEMLKTVDMLSDDISWCCTGMCGKKQPIPVGMGGPAIRCMANIGGR
ncbi:MAG: TldD/PmbA family protein [Clostridiales bacterium]|nr:TldD/PmbA family protein [Clostridiales bacterium]